MAKLNILLSELVSTSLIEWLRRAGDYAPSVAQRESPIIDHQIGPTVAVGGVILACLARVTVIQHNGLYLTDLLTVRSTLPIPGDVLPFAPGAAEDGTEIGRFERDIRCPEHKFILTCAGTIMSIYFGLVAGDLGKFGQPLRVRRCLPLGASPVAAEAEAGKMIVCPECRGLVWPTEGHASPVFHADNSRLVYQSFLD